jgi:hypothetical protein
MALSPAVKRLGSEATRSPPSLIEENKGEAIPSLSKVSSLRNV